jgi:hypothetical protein
MPEKFDANPQIFFYGLFSPVGAGTFHQAILKKQQVA